MGPIGEAIRKRFEERSGDEAGSSRDREKLKPLSEIERKLVDALDQGTEAFSGIEELVAPAVPLEKSEQCTIRAAVIETICSQPAVVTRNFPHAIRLRGYYIDEKLDLNSLHIPFHLVFKKCVFSQRIDLRCATIESLNLEGSKTEGVDADGLTVLGNLSLTNGFWSNRPFCLSGARIRGDLNCSKGQFHHNACPPDRFPAVECADCHARMLYAYALVLDRARIDGSLNLCGGFMSQGGVLLTDSHVGGNLNCTRGNFFAKGQTERAKVHGRRLACEADDDYHRSCALNGDGVHVGGNLLCNHIVASGETRLTGALIAGRIECATGRFEHRHSSAVYADRLRVRGNVFFCDNFSVEGSVRFPNAEFGADFTLRDGTLGDAKGSPALKCEGVTVQGTVYLRSLTIHGKGDLCNAVIGGSLDCSGSTFDNGADCSGSESCELRGAFSLKSARIGKDLNCEQSTFTSRRCHGIDAFGVTVGGKVDLKGVNSTGGIRLEDASVAGSLICTAATFLKPPAPDREDRLYLISAAKIKVGGSIYFNDGFSAAGWVRLVDANIGKSINFEKGEIINPSGFALQAQRMKVGGSVHLNKGFNCEGAVTLRSCEIGSDLDFSGAEVTNMKYERAADPDGSEQERYQLDLLLEGREKREEAHYAISAECASIAGSAMFMDKFKSHGIVSLKNAKIGIDLDCSDGEFENKRPCGEEDVYEARDELCYALNAEGVKVGGSARFKDDFHASGVVTLRGAEIANALQWMGVANPEHLRLDLRTAKAQVLQDDLDAWPAAGCLYLTGFTYQYLPPERKGTDIEQRLEKWLDKQKEFRPQPYEQLASVLQKTGLEEDAKVVSIHKNQKALEQDKWWPEFFWRIAGQWLQTPEEREKHKRRRLVSWEWLSVEWRRLSGPLIGYGYRPSRAVFAGLILVGIGTGVFYLGFKKGLMDSTKQWQDIASVVKVRCSPVTGAAAIAPRGSTAPASSSTGVTSPEHPLRFSFVYSLDTFLPVVDLKAGEYFVPTFSRLTGCKVFGVFVYLYYRLLILAGWIITAMLVAALGGMVRR